MLRRICVGRPRCGRDRPAPPGARGPNPRQRPPETRQTAIQLSKARRTASAILGGGQLGQDMRGDADHLNASIGSVAPDCFEHQEELIGKHGAISLVVELEKRIDIYVILVGSLLGSEELAELLEIAASARP